jgi:hypothetical protein
MNKYKNIFIRPGLVTQMVQCMYSNIEALISRKILNVCKCIYNIFVILSFDNLHPIQ